MNNDAYGIPASGTYATYSEREYFARDLKDRVRLLSDDDPLPPEFERSKKTWVRGEKIVAANQIQRMRTVRTTCEWRGHPFEVGIIIGDVANVVYLGRDFDALGGLPGMERTDKYEVLGEVHVAELEHIRVHTVDERELS